MGHPPLLSCPQLPKPPGESGEDRGHILTPCPDLSISVPAALPGAAIAPAATLDTLCIPPKSERCVTPAPICSCQGYFQTLAAPGGLGFSLGPHSSLAPYSPLGCPGEVAERFFKGRSVRQYSPTTPPCPPLALVVSKSPFPITPLGNCSLPSHPPCKGD